jgi:hypothetical protein
MRAQQKIQTGIDSHWRMRLRWNPVSCCPGLVPVGECAEGSRRDHLNRGGRPEIVVLILGNRLAHTAWILLCSKQLSSPPALRSRIYQGRRELDTIWSAISPALRSAHCAAGPCA